MFNYGYETPAAPEVVEEPVVEAKPAARKERYTRCTKENEKGKCVNGMWVPKADHNYPWTRPCFGCKGTGKGWQSHSDRVRNGRYANIKGTPTQKVTMHSYGDEIGKYRATF